MAFVTRADALMAQAGKIPAPRIGGMATPLGVYLTTGVVRGGVGDLALVLSGMVMALMLWIAQTLVVFLAVSGYHLTHNGILHDIYLILAKDGFNGSPTLQILVSTLTSALLIAVFMLFLRFMPKMAGYHAAEHQTVNAIEQGEQLTPEAVARMPRVHPRCGTNLWGLVMLIYLAVAVLSLFLSTPFGRQNLSLVVTLAIVAILGIAISWRTIGAWLQQHFTTRPASPPEIVSGIRAGEEVLYRHQHDPLSPPAPGTTPAAHGIAASDCRRHAGGNPAAIFGHTPGLFMAIPGKVIRNPLREFTVFGSVPRALVARALRFVVKSPMAFREEERHRMMRKNALTREDQHMIKQQLIAAMTRAAEKAREAGRLRFTTVPSFTLERPANTAFGDLSTNLAMVLASQVRMSPRQVAQILLDALQPDDTLIERMEIAGPGFINLYLKPDWLYEVVQAGAPSRAKRMGAARSGRRTCAGGICQRQSERAAEHSAWARRHHRRCAE